MLIPDDLDAPRPAAKLRDLNPLSIEELNGYIAALESEIARAEAMIAKKKAHKDGIEALFGTPTK